MKRLALPVLLVFAGLAAFAQQGSIGNLRNSKHDFSVSSAAQTKAEREDARCIFCHTPHRGDPAVPLWNKKIQEGTTYELYQSPTSTGAGAQPQLGDSSKLCLSCHDGTVPLGETVNHGLIPFQNVPADQRLDSAHTANVAGTGMNLSDDHPFNIILQGGLSAQLKTPLPTDRVRLDAQGRVQCVSCHDPHDEAVDATQRKFLVKNNSGSAICLSCHDLKSPTGGNWSWSGTDGPASSHKLAPNTYTASTNAGLPWLGAHTGYTTVAANSCASCHRTHSAPGATHLLKGQTDQVCFQCHNGNLQTGLRDVQSEFTAKMYVHPVIGPQPAHDAGEAPDLMPTRHATCTDCHNPHAARADMAVVNPPDLPAALAGTSGIRADGTPRDPRRGTGENQYAYELCFKCHADSPNQPQVPGYAAYGPLPARELPSTNLRLSFQSGASWHPVTRARNLTAGPGGEVPSLLPAPVDSNGSPIPGRTLSAASQISCTDCHNSDSGRNLGTGYAGPAGPHGSNINHILERNYAIEMPLGPPGSTPNVPYSAANYALCFKCHSEQSLRNDESFKQHGKHMQVAACSTCHDPHGVPGGSPSSNAALVNFDVNIVGYSSGGRREYLRTGFRQGTCSLTCHSVDHNSKNY